MSDAEQTTVDELASAERLHRQQIRSDAEVFQSLVKHPGWPRYIAMLEAIGNNFNRELMKPLDNALQAVRTEFAKGALTGIQAAASMPHAKIKEAADLKLGEEN